MVDCVGKKSDKENHVPQEVQLPPHHVGLVEAPELEESAEQVEKAEDRQVKHEILRTRPAGEILDQEARPAESIQTEDWLSGPIEKGVAEQQGSERHLRAARPAFGILQEGGRNANVQCFAAHVNSGGN